MAMQKKQQQNKTVGCDEIFGFQIDLLSLSLKKSVLYNQTTKKPVFRK